MKNAHISFRKIILPLVVVTFAYTIYSLDRNRLSESADKMCEFFEEEVGSVLNNNGLKFSGSFHYREKYYQKLAILYSDEYGLGKDIACYYERDSHRDSHSVVTVYFRKGVAENSILSNDKYFAFYIATIAEHANDFILHWKLTE